MPAASGQGEDTAVRRSVMGAVVAAAVVSSLVTLGVSELVAPRIAEAQGRALVGESLTLVGANGKARVAIGTFTGPGNREVGDFGIELFADDGSRRIAIQTGANSGTAAENPSISLFSR